MNQTKLDDCFAAMNNVDDLTIDFSNVKKDIAAAKIPAQILTAVAKMLEEKCLTLDELPPGTVLCTPGHEMLCLGKLDRKYYVRSTAGSIVRHETGKKLHPRDRTINTLDVRRDSGTTWLDDLNKAFMLCYPTTGGKDFDFPILQWYHDGVARCLKNQLMTNREDGTFGPEAPVTREQLTCMLYRFVRRQNGDFTDERAIQLDYPDMDSVSDWASEACAG